MKNSKSEENIEKQVSGFSKNKETEEKNKQENGEKKEDLQEYLKKKFKL